MEQWGTFPGETSHPKLLQDSIVDLFRRMSSHQFLTWSWSTLVFCSRTKIQNPPASPPLNDFKKLNEGFGAAESKSRLGSNWDVVAWPYKGGLCSQTLQCGWTETILQRRVDQNSSTAMWKTVIPNSWLQLLLLRVEQPVFRVRGQLAFLINWMLLFWSQTPSEQISWFYVDLQYDC